jgi:hypothetical protein
MNTSKWTTAIDLITSDFKDYFGNLSAERLNWKPTPQRWSIAQNIDHLIAVNKTYYPVLAQIRSGQYALPWTSRFGFLVAFFGKILLDSVKPDRKRKIKTFPIWQPSQSDIARDILAQFEKHQEQLKHLIESSSDLLDRGAIIASPANKNVVYKLETAYDIIVSHERRHFEQAKEVYVILPTL